MDHTYNIILFKFCDTYLAGCLLFLFLLLFRAMIYTQWMILLYMRGEYYMLKKRLSKKMFMNIKKQGFIDVMDGVWNKKNRKTYNNELYRESTVLSYNTNIEDRYISWESGINVSCYIVPKYLLLFKSYFISMYNITWYRIPAEVVQIENGKLKKNIYIYHIKLIHRFSPFCVIFISFLKENRI